MTRKLREHMKTAAAALFAAACFALANGFEDRIVNGARIGQSSADLVATAPTCYCQETCQ